MNLLCIESSTELCSVALLFDNGVDVLEQKAPRKHNELILEFADQLLERNSIERHDLSAIAIGRGPGAFTGVRIAASVAQGIALALSIPVITVSTLEILAQQIFDQDNADYVIPIMDARMNEVYWTVCAKDENGLAKIIEEEKVNPAKEVRVSVQGICKGVGSGWLQYSELSSVLPSIAIDDQAAATLPSARQLAKLAQREWQSGNVVAAEQAIPVYVRDNVVTKSKS